LKGRSLTDVIPSQQRNTNESKPFQPSLKIEIEKFSILNQTQKFYFQNCYKQYLRSCIFLVFYALYKFHQKITKQSNEPTSTQKTQDYYKKNDKTHKDQAILKKEY
jgi:amino acid permease